MAGPPNKPPEGLFASAGGPPNKPPEDLFTSAGGPPNKLPPAAGLLLPNKLPVIYSVFFSVSAAVLTSVAGLAPRLPKLVVAVAVDACPNP